MTEMSETLQKGKPKLGQNRLRLQNLINDKVFKSPAFRSGPETGSESHTHILQASPSVKNA